MDGYKTKSNFEAYTPTNSHIWKNFFKRMSERKITYGSFYEVKEENLSQTGGGSGEPVVKIISPIEAVVEKAKSLSSKEIQEQSAPAIKRKIASDARIKTKKLLKPLAVKRSKTKSSKKKQKK